MKPAFALDFRNDAIALLHRASGGWHQVGRVALDDPDLPDALSYLRATALGLNPRGLTTKLILPDDQLLVTTVDAPGPDEASRLAQIRAALEGRTPYPVEDLVFDWEEVAGQVRVAVVARVTLDEAEGFATEHRFNPVSFAAAPASGYSAEAWFGPSALAADLLQAGDVVERESTRTLIVERGLQAEEPPAPTPPAEDVMTAEATSPARDPAEPQPLASPDDARATAPAAAPVVADESVAEEVAAKFEPEPEPEPEPAVVSHTPELHAPELHTPEPEPRKPETAEPESPQPEQAGPETWAPIAADLFSAAAQNPARDTQQLFEPSTGRPTDQPIERQTPIFGLADDEPPPSQAFRNPNSFAVSPVADAPAAPTPKATFDSRAPDTKAQPEPHAAAQDAATNALPSDLSIEPPIDMPVDEAPMAVDVEQDDEHASDKTSDKTSDKDGRVTAVDNKPSSAAPSAVAKAAALLPGLGFASRRSPAEPPQSAKPAGTTARPIVDRPTAARPLVAPPPTKLDRPSLSRPTAVRPAAPKETKGLRGLGALVSAPSLPGSRKKVADPARTSAETAKPVITERDDQTAQSAGAVPPPPKGLGRSLGARPVPVRGKPRHLGLILTALLLLALAVVAAWSTSLAFRSDDATATEFAATQAADEAGSLPAVDDEMLADGQDPGLLSDEELAAALPATQAGAQAETDPSTPTAAETPGTAADATTPPTSSAPTSSTPTGTAEMQTAGAVTANPGAAAGDEIFLGTSDTAPATPDPTELAAVTTTQDPLPPAQAPPPPFGTVYQFDASGQILPTPEGIITPEGVLLVAGKPPRLPQARPQSSPQANTDVIAPADAPTATDAALPADPDLAQTQNSAFVADPALAGFRPKQRPEGLTPPATPVAPPSAEPGTEPATPAPTGTDDANLSPDAAPLPAAQSGLAGLRPKARPQTVLADGEAARAAASAASLAAQAEVAQAEAAQAEAAANLAPTADTSPLAVSISRKPQARPRDLSRAVEAAVAAAIRAPEPAPEPEAEQLAAAEPPPKKTQSRPRDEEASIYEEPEVEDSAPRGTASGSVAKQATFRNALAMDKTALIGVYGTPSQRYAMIRTTNGRYKKVEVGDKVDGGRIQAITASEVRYQKGSRLMTLTMPKG